MIGIPLLNVNGIQVETVFALSGLFASCRSVVIDGVESESEWALVLLDIL